MAQFTFYDPIVLDLAGDGFDFRGARDGVDFDYNGDGQTSRGGFIQGDDALLFLATPANGGRALDGRDLFGDAGGALHGFAALAEYDSNGDGVIDENDEIWESLRLWQDRNGDGICDEDEIMTLAQAGITSLNLSYANVQRTDVHGNVIAQMGAYTRADGTEGQMADAKFIAYA